MNGMLEVAWQAIDLQANDNRRNKQQPKRDTSYGQGEESDE